MLLKIIPYISRIAGILLSGLALSVPSSALEIEQLGLAFTREYTEDGKTEVVSGFAYCEVPDRLTLRVVSPVCQWMIFEKNLTTIYYPKCNRAFLIRMPFSSWPSFIQHFLAGAESDYGLSKLGYTPSDCAQRGDTLVSWWRPPELLARLLGESVIKTTDNKIIYAESQSANGMKLRESTSRDHRLLHGIYFPMEIVTKEYSKADSTIERTLFSTPQIDSVFLAEIQQFRIPQNAETKTVEW